jgi:hypothetical protein
LDGCDSLRYAFRMKSLLLAAALGSAFALSARAQNLLENGGFEQPLVTGRTPAGKGGSPAQAGVKGTWASLIADAETEGGRLQAGITDEIARTGKQSLYVDFDKVTASGRKAVLKTNLIPIKPSQAYRLSIWGRIDRKRPLALDERRPQMWLEVAFFQENGTTEAGEPTAGAQFIPGDIVPGGPHPLVFLSTKWKESSAQLQTPATARFMRVTWFWLTTREAGETDGTVFWDDATLGEDTTPPAKTSGEEGTLPGEAAPASAADAPQQGTEPSK